MLGLKKEPFVSLLPPLPPLHYFFLQLFPYLSKTIIGEERRMKDMESLEEKVSVFIDELHHSNESEQNYVDHPENISDSDDDDVYDEPPERTSYWESQLDLLQEILERYHASGSKLRHEVGRIIEMVKASDFCSCFSPNSSNCTTCFKRQVVSVLCNRGITTNLCISKWSATKKFLGGSHEYIEVIASTSKTKKQIPFLIELEFRDQFQIAKACEEYQKLVSCLPEFYIGKQEYLTAIVRVMCGAAKKSMKEKKMHLGPWRKRSFMQMKWSSFNPTYPHTQASKSHLCFSEAPTAVVVT